MPDEAQSRSTTIPSGSPPGGYEPGRGDSAGAGVLDQSHEPVADLLERVNQRLGLGIVPHELMCRDGVTVKKRQGAVSRETRGNVLGRALRIQ